MWSGRGDRRTRLAAGGVRTDHRTGRWVAIALPSRRRRVTFHSSVETEWLDDVRRPDYRRRAARAAVAPLCQRRRTPSDGAGRATISTLNRAHKAEWASASGCVEANGVDAQALDFAVPAASVVLQCSRAEVAPARRMGTLTRGVECRRRSRSRRPKASGRTWAWRVGRPQGPRWAQCSARWVRRSGPWWAASRGAGRRQRGQGRTSVRRHGEEGGGQAGNDGEERGVGGQEGGR